MLVVEDDETVSDVVGRYLSREGFGVEIVNEGRAAIERATQGFDLVILDIMLPGVDGLEVSRQLRAKTPVPIIMLTALGEESDRVMGLDLGADDYITKPFSPRELMARVRSVLRRASGPLSSAAASQEPMVAGDLVVDPTAHEVRLGDRLVMLTAIEFDLLSFLMRHPRQVFTREDLLERVWGYVYGDKSTVTVHVRRLREKIEEDPAQPMRVITVWGVGYRFDP